MTKYQEQVLRMTREGLGSSQIASALGKSPGSVRGMASVLRRRGYDLMSTSPESSSLLARIADEINERIDIARAEVAELESAFKAVAS